MKKILITGASGGIGSSIADKFLNNQYEMILTSSSDTNLSKLKEKYGSNHYYYALDFNSPDVNNIILLVVIIVLEKLTTLFFSFASEISLTAL